MTALTTNVARDEKESKLVAFPVAANAIIFRGSMVKINAAGYLEACSAEAGALFVGTAREGVDATGLASGECSIQIEIKNSFYVAAAGIVALDLMKKVYAADDNLVQLAVGVNLQEVGRILEIVSATKVLVQPNFSLSK